MSALGSQPQKQITTAVYADGNARASSMKGRAAQVTATLLDVEQGDRELLEYDADSSPAGWLGEKVWVRDDRSRRFAAVFSNPQITEHGYDGLCDIILTFNQVYENDLK